MKTCVRRLSFALLTVAAVIWFGGCLSGRYFAMVRYDQAKDEFTILNVYQGINCATPGDQEYLYQLWRNRDHLIRVPNLDVFNMPAFLRMSPTKYAAINLGEAPPTLDPVETTLALDQIRTLPGTFFLRGPDTLCYYDQLVLPGKVIDQAMPLLLKSLAPGMTEAIDKEVQRRKDGGKVVDWAAYRREIVQDVHSSSNPSDPSTAPATAPVGAPATAPAQSEAKTEPLQVLDDQSLQLLRKGIADGSLKLTRDMQVFRLTLPLSDADARQVEESWRAMFDAIRTDAPKGTVKTPTFAFIVSRLERAFKLTTHPSAVELEINLAVIIEELPALDSISKPLNAPTPEQLTSMRDTIAALRARGVPIDEKLTVEQLARQFVTKSVKTYPSDHPVEPGSGLAQAPPVKK